MAQEPAHVELLEFKKENIPYMNWMFEDLFCLYGTSIPFFLLDFEFPQYPREAYGFSGYDFNIEWGDWDYWLPWFNELLGLLFDEAHLPRWQMPDFSDISWSMFNDYITTVYDNIQRHDWYSQTGTFTKDEVVEGGASAITGYYKWKDGDDHIYIANKQDSSGEAIANYEEEKVTGQTSGAYAYTYEDYWEEEEYTPNVTPQRLQKYGLSCGGGGSIEAAWADFTSNPTWVTHDIAAAYYMLCQHRSYYGKPVDCGGDWGYQANEDRGYVEFDTSTLGAGGASAKITFTTTLSILGNGASSRTLALYEQDFGDSVDSDDWDGGEEIATVEVDAGEQSVEIPFDISHVNVGGLSRYKILVKEDPPTTEILLWQFLYVSDIKLIVTT